MAKEVLITTLLENAAASARDISEHQLIRFIHSYVSQDVLIVPIKGKSKEEILEIVKQVIK